MDEAAMNSHLAASYGPDRATARPASHEFALFFGDPMYGGVEITGGGYARVTFDGDTEWDGVPSGGAYSTIWKSLPSTTGEYDSEATHWALIYDDGGDVIDDSGPLVDTLNVTSAGSGPLVRATVRFADSITPEED